MKEVLELCVPQKRVYVNQYVHDINYYRFNWHKEFELNILLKGSADFSVNGVIHRLEEDDVLLINPTVGHASIAAQRESISMVIHFDPVFFAPQFDNYTTLRFVCASSPKDRNAEKYRRLRKYAADMMTALSDESFTGQICAEAYFYLLASELLRHCSPYNEEQKKREEGAHRKNIKMILDFMEQNYNSKITLEDIARLCRYNRTYVSGFFKSCIGVNFYEYLTMIRFRHAVHELLTTEKTLTAIAIDNGFPDLKTFNSKFYSQFGKLPSKYRYSVEGMQIHPSENHRNYFSILKPEISEKLNEYRFGTDCKF